MLNIYNQIISKLSHMKSDCIPISNIAAEFGFIQTETNGNDEFYRAELNNGTEKIILRIWGSDHSGELQYREDTYHNEIIYINANGESYQSSYMFLSD